MKKLLFKGKELSTRSRMKTLEEAIDYFEKAKDSESVSAIKEIIKEKEKP